LFAFANSVLSPDTLAAESNVSASCSNFIAVAVAAVIFSENDAC
jgi:hypothetical protein